MKIFSAWWGKAVAVAIVMFLASVIWEKLRTLIYKVLKEYAVAHLQRFWYWLSNKAFTVSGYVEYSFSSDLASDDKSKNRFDNALGANDSPVLLDGPHDFGAFQTRLRDKQDVRLEIKTTTGAELADMSAVAGLGPASVEGGCAEAATILNVKWDRAVIHYREFSDVVTSLRRAADFIKEQFAQLVNNQIPNKESAFLQVFFRPDCKVDRTVRLKVSLTEGAVELEKIIGEADFRARTLDAIAPHLPRYLVKETLSELLKKHGVIS